MLKQNQELFIATEHCVYKVTDSDCHDLSQVLSNNHEEADTLIFALCYNLDLKE